jgi:hypothetical protein
LVEAIFAGENLAPDAAPRERHGIRDKRFSDQLLMSADQVFWISLTTESGIGM